jgi:hypothetical protein
MYYVIDHADFISSASYAGSASSASYQTSSTDTAGIIEEQATIKTTKLHNFFSNFANSL